VLAAIRPLYPGLRHVFADGGYAGDKLRAALKGKGSWTLEIIKRSDIANGFEAAIASAVACSSRISERSRDESQGLKTK